MDWKESIRETAVQAAQAAQRVARSTKIRISIAGEEERIRKAYLELGKLCHRDYLTDTVSGGEAYLVWHQKIDDGYQQIQLLREQLAQLKREASGGDCCEGECVVEDCGQPEEAPEEPRDDV